MILQSNTNSPILASKNALLIKETLTVPKEKERLQVSFFSKNLTMLIL